MRTQCILFKGFSSLTNMGYEDEVPLRYDEMLMSLVAQNAKVVLDAYILGTLFHYLVKKDPEQEASKALMAALDVYCVQRALPQSLHDKMREYLRFQQQHSTAAADHVVKVRAHVRAPHRTNAATDTGGVCARADADPPPGASLGRRCCQRLCKRASPPSTARP